MLLSADVFLDCVLIPPNRGYKITSRPKMGSGEISFPPAKVSGQPNGAFAFDISHRLGNRVFWRDADQHVNVVSLQALLFQAALLLFGKAAEHRPQLLSQLTIQQLAVAFGYEYDVIPALPACVGKSFSVVHDWVWGCFERLTPNPSGDSRNCQTLGVSPAKPAVYPLLISRF